MKTTTPKQLALELNVTPKRLRAHLRKYHARTLDAKNTTWAIDAKTANACRKAFAAKRAS